MTISIRDMLSVRLASNGFSLSVDQESLVLKFMAIFREWNSHINLSSHRNLEDLIDKDIVDSLFLNKYIIEYVNKIETLLDMGCGAGFVGIMVSILNPDAKIAFLDSDRKKINFVRHSCRELKLQGNIFLKLRAEDKPREWHNFFQLTVSRATWQVTDYIKNANYYVQKNGMMIYMAGRGEGNRSLLAQVIRGFPGTEEKIYKISPKDYARRLFFIG